MVVSPFLSAVIWEFSIIFFCLRAIFSRNGELIKWQSFFWILAAFLSSSKCLLISRISSLCLFSLDEYVSSLWSLGIFSRGLAVSVTGSDFVVAFVCFFLTGMPSCQLWCSLVARCGHLLGVPGPVGCRFLLIFCQFLLH